VNTAHRFGNYLLKLPDYQQPLDPSLVCLDALTATPTRMAISVPNSDRDAWPAVASASVIGSFRSYLESSHAGMFKGCGRVEGACEWV
jgi:hypothetical protein